MRIGLGGTEQYQREKILGRTFCANGVSKVMTAKYWYALQKGHSVVPLVHEVFGAWSDDCVEQLDRMGEIREGRLDKEFHDASWTERSFHNYYATRISTALHVGMANMILAGARMASQSAMNSDGCGMTGRRRRRKQCRGTAD